MKDCNALNLAPLRNAWISRFGSWLRENKDNADALRRLFALPLYLAWSGCTTTRFIGPAATGVRPFTSQRGLLIVAAQPSRPTSAVRWDGPSQYAQHQPGSAPLSLACAGAAARQRVHRVNHNTLQ